MKKLNAKRELDNNYTDPPIRRSTRNKKATTTDEQIVEVAASNVNTQTDFEQSTESSEAKGSKRKFGEVENTGVSETNKKLHVEPKVETATTSQAKNLEINGKRGRGKKTASAKVDEEDEKMITNQKISESTKIKPEKEAERTKSPVAAIGKRQARRNNSDSTSPKEKVEAVSAKPEPKAKTVPSSKKATSACATVANTYAGTANRIAIEHWCVFNIKQTLHSHTQKLDLSFY